jgi:putative hemolysin
MTKKLIRNTRNNSANFIDNIPVIATNNYVLKLAKADELESILRLRFKVFNIELGLGKSTPDMNDMDADEFDPIFHHLILGCKKTGATIGTYRMQTYSMATQALGFRCAKYFNIDSISDAVLKSTVEIGGACVAREHRNLEALSLLWKGLANYLLWSGNKYFLGCTTLPTDDIVQATCAYNYFQKNNLIHPNFLVYPQSQFYCDIGSYSPDVVQLKLPTILQIYLASGAKICSLPALDKDYKCIDFLTIFDSTNFAPVRSLMSTTRSTLSSLVKI